MAGRESLRLNLGTRAAFFLDVRASAIYFGVCNVFIFVAQFDSSKNEGKKEEQQNKKKTANLL